MHSPFLFPMGKFVLSKDAKELCFDSWALAARALFHNALMSMDAKYKVCKGIINYNVKNVHSVIHKL